jgi:chromosome segregation ATPase
VREMKQTHEPIKTQLRVETEKNEDFMEEIRKLKTEISYYKGQAGEFEKLVILINEQTQRIEHMERKNKENEQKYNENEQKYNENEQKIKELEQKNRKAEDENEDLLEVIRNLKLPSIKPQPVEPDTPTETSLSLLD